MKNTIIQNEKNIQNHIDKIESINKKLEEITVNKSCDCASYNTILQKHDNKIELLYRTFEQEFSKKSAEEK